MTALTIWVCPGCGDRQIQPPLIKEVGHVCPKKATKKWTLYERKELEGVGSK
jgi:hypothetical protein